MNILFVGAHADDLELSCGGTIARGYSHNVHCILTSNSFTKKYNGDLIREQDNARKEAIYSLNGVLNVKLQNIHFLDFPNKDVPYNSEIVEKLNELIDKIKPDLIFTHWINDTHPDHANTSKAVISAARYYHNILMFEPIYPSNVAHRGAFKPQVYIDISNEMNDKLDAIAIYNTEKKRHKFWNDLIIAMNRERGIEIGEKYAEAYEPVKLEYNI